MRPGARRLLVAGSCVALSLATLSGCSGERIPADTVYVGGHVVTADDDFSVVEAFAVADGRFVAVGSSAEVRAAVSADATVVELDGATVLPGFNDNHIHLGPGRGLQPWEDGLIPDVPAWTRGVSTLDALLSALAGEVAARPPGTWIRGGLNRMDWPNAVVPTRGQLDEVAPDHPVLLTRGPHTYLLNSLALRLAGIDERTPDPEGGWIFRDARGRPTGRVLEAARRIVDRVAPPAASRVGWDEGIEAMRRALADLEALGITSVNIAGVRPGGVRQVQELYARHGPQLPRATMQIRLSPGHDSYDDPEEGVRSSIAELEALAFRTGFGDDRLKLGAVKMSIDGGLSAPVFWSLEDYEGRPGFRGAVRIPADVFRPVAKRAHELGWQLGIHTMGDGAVEMVVAELAAILEELPREGHRHYLHHVAVKPPPETLRAMAEHGIMVASQPAFTVGLGAYAEEALTAEREATQNPTRSLQEAGVRVSHGSDSAPYGPLITMWTAVTRRGHDGKVHGPEEAVSVEEAIRLHTRAPAYFTWDEEVKGAIRPGMLADFVVLSGDVLAIDPDDLRTLRVDATFVGGRQVYARAGRVGR